MKGLCADHRHPERIAPITYHEALSWYRMNPNPKCSMYGTCTYTLRLQMATFKGKCRQLFLTSSIWDWLAKFWFTQTSDTNLRPPWKRRNIYMLKPPILGVPAVYFWGRGPQQSRSEPSKKQWDTSSEKVVFPTWLLPSQTSIYANKWLQV